jgi:hypothetical protein
MTGRTKKTLIVIGASLTVVVVGWVMLVGSVLAWGGVATVDLVERNGTRVTVPIPMAVVDAAVASGDLLFDVEDHLNVQLDLGEWGPLVREMLEELDECPDAVLVEVVDGSDHVRVVKDGGSLLVEVSDSDVDLRVSIPTRSIRRTVGRLVS